MQEASLRAFLLTNLVAAPEGSAHKYRWRCNLRTWSGCARAPLPPASASLLTRLATTDTMHDTLPDLRFVGIANGANRYPGETLFIGGARSNYLQERHAADIAAAFPAAALRIVPDAGHWVHADKPAEFLDLATPFLCGLPLPDAVL